MKKEIEREEHEKLIREYLGVRDSEITEYEHIEDGKYYVTLLIDTDEQPQRKHLNRWRKVEEELPEENEELLNNTIPDIECTKYVLVKASDGHIYENRRIKMAIGAKEWKWHMSVENDFDFTEWKPIN